MDKAQRAVGYFFAASGHRAGGTLTAIERAPPVEPGERRGETRKARAQCTLAFAARWPWFNQGSAGPTTSHDRGRVHSGPGARQRIRPAHGSRDTGAHWSTCCSWCRYCRTLRRSGEQSDAQDAAAPH